MAARMKVEDLCCKSKAVLSNDLFRPERTAVTILSFLFCQRRQETREIGKERKECGIGVVKAASFLDIIYLSAVGREEQEGGLKQVIQRKR